MDQNENTPTKQSLTSVLAIIEKVHELRWTLHLAMMVLFADLVLVWRGERGIIHWSTSADQLLAHAGLLITGVLAFGILMSFVMPLAFWLFQQLGWILNPYLSWMQTERDYQPSDGNVRPTDILDYALRKGDKLLLDIYEAHERKQIARFSDELAVCQMMFSFLMLALLDYYLPGWIGIQGTTVLQALALLGKFGENVLIIGFLLAFAAVVNFAWLTEYSQGWIYYPPLYKEIEEQRRKERKLYEEMEVQSKNRFRDR